MAKNTHLEHLEDDILNNAWKAVKTAFHFLKNLVKC